MEKWEYKTIDNNSVGMESSLNKLGNEGWELVSVVPSKEKSSSFFTTETSTVWVMCFLKRKVIE